MDVFRQPRSEINKIPALPYFSVDIKDYHPKVGVFKLYVTPFMTKIAV